MSVERGGVGRAQGVIRDNHGRRHRGRCGIGGEASAGEGRGGAGAERPRGPGRLLLLRRCGRGHDIGGEVEVRRGIEIGRKIQIGREVELRREGVGQLEQQQSRRDLI